MNKQYKSDDGQNQILSSEEEQRADLYCNNVHSRCSSLDFNPNNELIAEDVAINYLASILSESVLNEENGEHK